MSQLHRLNTCLRRNISINLKPARRPCSYDFTDMLRRLTNCRIIIIIIIITQYSHPCRFVYDAFPANALCDIVSLIKDLWLCAAYRMLRDQVPLHRFHPFSNYNNYNDSNLAGRCMARAVMSRGDQEQWVKFPTVVRWRLKVAQHNNSYKQKNAFCKLTLSL